MPLKRPQGSGRFKIDFFIEGKIFLLNVNFYVRIYQSLSIALFNSFIYWSEFLRGIVRLSVYYFNIN